LIVFVFLFFEFGYELLVIEFELLIFLLEYDGFGGCFVEEDLLVMDEFEFLVLVFQADKLAVF
jgi:hypothetical protein